MKARMIILVAALGATLFAAVPAFAHGTYPSEHHAAAVCRETRTNGQWAVSSNVYMNKAAGFEGATVLIGIDGTWKQIQGYSDQWLYYRVVVATQSSFGTWNYQYGTWMRRQNALGDGTDGISTEVETYPSSGVYTRTGYGAAGAPEDVSMASGRIGVGPRTKYIYGEMWWGPITDMYGRQAFAPYTHWEPLGWVTCG